jgi:hypothetical protein
MKALTFLVSLVSCACLAAPADNKENQTDLLFSGTIRANYPAKNTTMKGLVIKLGDDEKTFVCYDTDLMRLSLAWTGGFLKFGNYQREISHPQPPEVAGSPIFGTQPGPGWAKARSFTDPRENHQGPLPRAWAKYRGLYRHGRSVILSYTVGNRELLEMPAVETIDGDTVITRVFRLGKSSEPLSLLVAEAPNAEGNVRGNSAILNEGTNRIIATIAGAPTAAAWEVQQNKLVLKLPGAVIPLSFQVSIWKGPGDKADAMSERLQRKVEMFDLAALTQGGQARWAEPVRTQGVVTNDVAPYVVDVLTDPAPNPWGTRTFFGGFDFFPDGRAAICTFHGDVWIVSGIDATLRNLTWRRYASGLFQALGLKIVGGKVYVTGRDQITRLHDLNNDGEADYYENFNNDTVVTPNYHEFCLDLQTDQAGNFYFAKGAPWPPNVNSPHQGTLLKVSKDGSKLEVFATGLRAPNGLGMGPHDEITVSDNEGHWIPSSKVNLIRKGGFYGMMPAAHLDTKPHDFDKPICWLPKSQDNSGGGQLWVTSDKWGPLKDHMLFTSYGKGTLFYTMLEEIEDVTQAAMVRLLPRFPTGVMRGRVNPKDGQVYLCGLRGWQTDGVREGGFYRVRYTGQPAHLPTAFHVVKGGLEITFTSPLSATEATSVDNYDVEQWNYKWTSDYGSPEFSPSNPDSKRHDKVTVQSVKLSTDQKTAFLEIPGLRPVDQMRVKFKISAADGTPISHEIYNTIHRISTDRKLTMK